MTKIEYMRMIEAMNFNHFERRHSQHSKAYYVDDCVSYQRNAGGLLGDFQTFISFKRRVRHSLEVNADKVMTIINSLEKEGLDTKVFMKLPKEYDYCLYTFDYDTRTCKELEAKCLKIVLGKSEDGYFVKTMYPVADKDK